MAPSPRLCAWANFISRQSCSNWSRSRHGAHSSQCLQFAVAILCSAGACVLHGTRQPLFAFVFAAADAINAAVVAIGIAIATCRFVLIPICGCVKCPSPARPHSRSCSGSDYCWFYAASREIKILQAAAARLQCKILIAAQRASQRQSQCHITTTQWPEHCAGDGFSGSPASCTLYNQLLAQLLPNAAWSTEWVLNCESLSHAACRIQCFE